MYGWSTDPSGIAIVRAQRDTLESDARVVICAATGTASQSANHRQDRRRFISRFLDSFCVSTMATQALPWTGFEFGRGAKPALFLCDCDFDCCASGIVAVVRVPPQ